MYFETLFFCLKDEINHKVTLFAILVKVKFIGFLDSIIFFQLSLINRSLNLIKTWKDEFLTWNPKEFGNIEYTYVKYNQIWTPQLQLVTK